MDHYEKKRLSNVKIIETDKSHEMMIQIEACNDLAFDQTIIQFNTLLLLLLLFSLFFLLLFLCFFILELSKLLFFIFSTIIAKFIITYFYCFCSVLLLIFELLQNFDASIIDIILNIIILIIIIIVISYASPEEQ